MNARDTIGIDIHANVTQNSTIEYKDEGALKRAEADVEALKADVESLSDQLSSAQSQIRNLFNEIDRLNEESGVTALNEELERFKETASVAAEEFRAFVKSAKLSPEYSILGEARFEDDRLQEWFESVKDGSVSVGQAISNVKQQYAALLTENYNANGGIFDAEMVQSFIASLESLSGVVNDVHQAVLSMQQDGVKAIGDVASVGGGTGGEVANIMSQIEAAAAQMSEEAKNAYGPITDLVKAITEYANLDNTKLLSVSHAFRNIADIGEGSFGSKSLNNIVLLAKQLSAIAASGPIRFDVQGMNDLRINRASFKNLAEYLPTIAGVDTGNLAALSKIDFSNLNNVKVSKASLEGIASLTEAVKILKEYNAVKLESTQTGVNVNATAPQSIIDEAKVKATATGMDELVSETRQYVGALQQLASETTTLRDEATNTTTAITEGWVEAEDGTKRWVETTRKVTTTHRTASEEIKAANGELLKIINDEIAAQRLLNNVRSQQASMTKAGGSDAAKSPEYQNLVSYEMALNRLLNQLSAGKINIEDFKLAVSSINEEYVKNTAGVNSFIETVRAESDAVKKAQREEVEAYRELRGELTLTRQYKQNLNNATALRDKMLTAGGDKAMNVAAYQGIDEYITKLQALRAEYETTDMSDDQFRLSMEELNNTYIDNANAAQSYIKAQQESAAAVKQQVSTLIKSYTSLMSMRAKAGANIIQDEGGRFVAADGSAEYYTTLAGKLNDIIDRYNALKATIQSMPDGADKTNLLQQMSDAAEKAGLAFEKYAAETENAAAAAKDFYVVTGRTDDELRKSTKVLSSGNEDIRNMRANLEAARAEVERAFHNAEQTGEGYGEVRAKLKELETQTMKYTAAAKNAGLYTQSFGDRLKKVAGAMTMWFSTTRIIMMVFRELKEMVRASMEVESSLAQLKIVTNATDGEMAQFSDTIFTLSRRLGQSATDVAKSIETFSRLGYNLPDASKLAEFATIMSNVADTSAEDATKGLTSIIKGYGMDVDNTSHVADVLVSVGQKYAVSASELMTAFEKSGAALAATNTSFEKSAGIIAAANAAVQNASTVGTALKTVSARIRGSKTDLDELGEDASDLADGFSKYAEEMKALTGFDIRIEGTTNQFKDLYDIFEGISKVWDSLSDTAQARVSEILGGTRMLQVISSILTNFDDAAGAYKAAMEDIGAATRANEIYLDTTEAKVKQLKTVFTELATSVFNSADMKGVVSMLTGLLNVIGGIAKFANVFGGLKTTLVAIAGVIATIKADAIKVSVTKMFSTLSGGMGTLKDFGMLIRAVFLATRAGVPATKAMSGALSTLGVTASNAQIAMGAVGIAITAISAAIGVAKKIHDEYVQSLERNYAKGMESAQESDAIYEAYKAYLKEKQAIDEGVGSKQALADATEALTEALGKQKEASDEAAGSLREMSLEELKAAKAGADAAVKNAQLLLKETWGKKGYGDNTVARVIKNAVNGENTDEGLDLFTKSKEVADNLSKAYDLLIKKRQELTDLDKEDSAQWKANESAIAFIEDAVLNYRKAIESSKEIQEQIDNINDDKVLDFATVTVNGVTYATKSIEQEKEAIEALNSAIEESNSETGLSAKTIESLTSRYKNVQGHQEALAKLFEETTSGIRLNTKALDELEDAYVEQTKLNQDQRLKDLKDRYNDLTHSIDMCTDAKQRELLEGERSSLLDQIKEVTVLKTSYEALTAAYNDWINAQERPDERDKYANLGEGYEKVSDLIKAGWLGDAEVKTYIDAMLNADEVTGDVAEDFKKLTETIEGTNFSIMDFFMYDSDDNLTAAGLYNFMDAVKALFNDEYVRTDENGRTIFDFTEGKLDDVAKKLGISTELVGIFVQALKDVDGSVAWENAMPDLSGLESSFSDKVKNLSDALADGYNELVNGNVDYAKRPFIAAEKMIAAGWKDFNEDVATTFSEEKAFTNAEGVNFNVELTPILEDGTVLSPEALDEYFGKLMGANDIDEILALDDKNLVINIQEGERDDAYWKDLERKLQDIKDAHTEIHDLFKDGTLGYDPEKLNEQLEALKGIQDQANAGKINLGTEGLNDLNDLIDGVQARIDHINESNIIMRVDTDSIDDKKVQNTVSILQSLNEKMLSLKDLDVLNVDTTAVNQEIQDIVAQLDGLDNKTKKTLGINTDEAKAAIEEISGATEINGELTLPDDAVATIQGILDNLSENPKILLDIGLSEVWDPSVDGWITKDGPKNQTAEVEYTPDTTSIDDYDFTQHGDVIFKPDTTAVDNKNYDKTATINYNLGNVPKPVLPWLGVGGAQGTAHAYGTARARGDWRTKGSGVALGGEVGPELLVRDGRFYTIGADSAEFFKYRRGDIIFNAEQTRQILLNGKIANGQRRGVSYLQGTAFYKEHVPSVWGSIGSYTPPAGGTNAANRGTGTSSKSSSTKSTGSSSSSSSYSSSAKEDAEKAESWFEKAYKEHQHLLKMDAENVKDYLEWLMDAYKQAYDEGIIELDDYYKYEEEVYSGLHDLFEDYLNDVEHEIDMRKAFKGESKKIYAIYTKLISDVEEEIARAREAGLDDTDDYIQSLQKKWADYTEERKSLTEDAEKAAKDSVKELVDIRIKMLKQDLDNERDALSKKLDNLREFYDKQKKLLRDERDEEKYLDEQAEKRREVANLQYSLNQLEYDNSAWAQKRKLELAEELAKAQKDLDDFEKDHAIEMAEEKLDKLQEMQEKEIELEQEQLEKQGEDAKALYDQALEDIKNGSIELYEEMIKWNNVYGDGISDTITQAWEDAYIALGDYKKLVGEDFDGVKLANATGYKEPAESWDTASVSSGKSLVPDDTPTTPKAAASEPKGNSGVTIDDALKRKIAAAIWNGGYGWGGGDTRAARLAEVFGENNGIQALVSQGVGKWDAAPGSEYSYENMRKKLKGYASGTKNAVAGLHPFEELGTETTFESADGTRFKMFTGGEKVLTAKASNFLYDFASSGGRVLENLFRSVSNGLAREISALTSTTDIKMGDIIIEGNTNEATVSEIRRAQRDQLNLMLREFNRLSKA